METAQGRRGLTIEQIANLAVSGDIERLRGLNALAWGMDDERFIQENVKIGPRIVMGENFELTYEDGRVSTMIWIMPIFVPVEECKFD